MFRLGWKRQLRHWILFSWKLSVLNLSSLFSVLSVLKAANLRNVSKAWAQAWSWFSCYFCTYPWTLLSIIWSLFSLHPPVWVLYESGRFHPFTPFLTAMRFCSCTRFQSFGLSSFHCLFFLFIHDDGKCKFTIKFPSKYAVWLFVLFVGCCKPLEFSFGGREQLVLWFYVNPPESRFERVRPVFSRQTFFTVRFKAYCFCHPKKLWKNIVRTFKFSLKGPWNASEHSKKTLLVCRRGCCQHASQILVYCIQQEIENFLSKCSGKLLARFRNRPSHRKQLDTRTDIGITRAFSVILLPMLS